MLKRIIIRVDADQKIGLGHMARMIGLAKILKENFRVIFFVQRRDFSSLALLSGEDFDVFELGKTEDYLMEAFNLKGLFHHSDIVVLDGYWFDSRYQEEVRKNCSSVVLISDDVNAAVKADIIIDHSEWSRCVGYKTEPYTKQYLGAGYALLRPEFRNNRQRSADLERVIRRILVCMGGADPDNISLHILRSIEQISREVKVQVIVGQANPYVHEIKAWIKSRRSQNMNVELLLHLSAQEMVEAMVSTDLFIAPGSGLALEAFSVGVPTICGVIAENHVKIAESYGALGVCLFCGWFNEKSPRKIAELIEHLNENLSVRRRQVLKQHRLLDQKSSERLLDIFKNLV